MTSGLAEAIEPREIAKSDPVWPRPHVGGRAVPRARVVVLLRRLDIGGAERQLLEFVRALPVERVQGVTLLSFYAGGDLVAETSRIEGLQTISLGKRSRWHVVSFLAHACRTVYRLRPQVLYGYQRIPNELALVIGRLVGARVVWGIRQSDVHLRQFDWLSRLLFHVGAYLSRFADLIIVNSESGLRNHAAFGYARDRMVVISNGIDTARFRPDPAAGAALRREWGIVDGVVLVGIVGRLHPVKDHQTFLKAAALVHARQPRTRFVCVGDGPADYRAQLLRLTRDLGLEGHVLWAGNDLRMPAVMNALDVLCSSSVSEGFSNVIGEAMACGKPSVVTDVGDSARLVADCGAVVPARSPEALAGALETCISFDPEQARLTGARARARIEEHFSVERMVHATWSALESLA